MADASDVITYIGVPLAVLGVVPLLWNFYFSVVIWRKVHQDLPKEAHKFFRFRLDPVNGRLHGSFRRLKLNIEDFLDEKKARLNNIQWTSPSTVGDIIANSWMCLLNMPLKIKAINTWNQDFALAHASKPPSLPLECDWTTFVCLALAVGVSPYEEGLQTLKRSASIRASLPFILMLRSESENGGELIQVSFPEGHAVAAFLGRQITVDLRRLLAWSLVMVVPQGPNWYCISLIHSIRSRNSIIAPSVLKATSCKVSDDNLLPIALSWTLYSQEHFDHSQKKGLPTPQVILKARKLAMKQLRLLSEETDALLAPCAAGDRAAVQHAVRSAEPTLDSTTWKALASVPAMTILRESFAPTAILAARPPTIDLNDLKREASILARLVVAFSSACSTPEYRWFPEKAAWEKTSWTTKTNEFTAERLPVLPPDPIALLLQDENDVRPPEVMRFA